MRTNDILKEIFSNGGFSNINNWTQKEIAEYIYNAYNCSKYVANNVAFYLK